MNSNFIGTGVALVTPFNDDNSIDYKGLGNVLSHILKGGADYVVVNGTTAESPTTTEEEKKESLKFILKEINKQVPVVFGLGGNNTAEVVSKMERMDLSGVAAILSISPYYNKPSQEGIFLHYKTLAENAPVPVILYNVPGRTGSNISARTTVRLSEVDNIIGIKEANADMTQSLEILKNARKDFLLISGDDMLALSMISMGGKGAISVLANAYPSQFSKMIRYSLEYKFSEAVELLKSISGINNYMYEEGNPVGIKYVLQELGLCKEITRLPLTGASADLKKRIVAAMKDIK